MSLKREDVKHLADLARLELSEDETRMAEKELDSILKYVDRLQKIDTAEVEPYAMPSKSTGWRKDEFSACDEAATELILSNFPERESGLLSVPPVFETPKK
ncbi:Asp-tRNA(Asn)/Glu-tRNA(Gln) amidotransferase subunit GatC [Patescibacteria group bacterium]|nr:Asp-tRNA(Asn)/Glu-tRNA(Gln) amidotransferase subunit GatC [Patescibacteria group bacterium]MBU1034987.1 Asp-tRNA(Asn)/Glu-tRNA(Gln) amidotransferase subunit GatC [Patescibacteria group bacterium]MBU1630020.1 Asp-tRNA(Asn)/Glu-tRNA(Gln) amidotransferase subunit GatC [Patescibacteria group bacterium]MBU1908038.1 Asp-tRNA(Asn)/Glu-tRNA(Gln) amidotransferase subunit GatC [Patescibacteria group bacterium]